MSPESWEYFLKPRMERWCRLVHSYGLKVFYHTDGASEKLIGPLIDCGIDILNPIQPCLSRHGYADTEGKIWQEGYFSRRS